MNTRTEQDSMGSMQVPETALYGASTQRAVLNFPISGEPVSREFLQALGLVKWAAARANATLGDLPKPLAIMLERAAEEMIEGKLDSHFPVDVFQTGSGTSTNMNANEVLANRTCQLDGRPLGSHDFAHPNDHVNKGQSSNDVIPTAIHIAVACAIQGRLEPSLRALQHALQGKAAEFQNVLKIGRTHLMDATPVRLGQEFGGYARQVELGAGRANRAVAALCELALGGTAVGTGLNARIGFADQAIALIRERTGIAFREAADHFEAQSAKDGLVEASGLLRTIAISLFKIANDIRWLSSGPRCGLGEIRLPATQPGSSIMPGKVNPVMSESLMQVCAQVIGNDAAVAWAAAQGNLELNVMMPVIARNMLESVRLLTNGTVAFCEKCVIGIEANAERCAELVERSMAMVTSLVPWIGYDRAAQIAKECAATGKTVRELCMEQKVLSSESLEQALDSAGMTQPSE